MSAVMFATFDQDGRPTGFFDPQLHAGRIPAEAVQITVEQWQELYQNQQLRRWNGSTVVEYTPPIEEPTLDERYPPLAPYQFDAILQLSGLTESLAAVLAALPEQQRIVAQAKMNRMSSYYRSDPLLNQLAAALSLTTEQVNDLWTQAREL